MPSAPHILFPESHSARVLLPQESREVIRRLRVLSRITNEITRLRTEPQLIAAVIEQLFAFFESARFAEVMLCAHGDVPPIVYSRERGAGLQTLESGGFDALPIDHRDQFRVPTLLGPETISVPLLAGHTLVGLMVVEAQAGHTYSQTDLDAVTGVAAQTTMCLHNLRSSRRSDARRLERDLQSAARAQRSLLPVLPGRIDGFKIKAEYRPAYEVGGDFYDAMSTHPGRLIAMVGDVAGKGVSGALVMARAVTEFRRIARHARSPERMLRELNDAFSQQVCDETFITAVCLDIDLKKSRMTVANAGHVVPLVRRASGQMVPVGGASGPPIGMLPDQTYRNETFPIEPGDIVLLMSDGILDALHREGDELGMWALRDIVAAAPRDIVEINRRILEAVDFRTRGTPPDDITLLAIEVDSAYIVGA